MRRVGITYNDGQASYGLVDEDKKTITINQTSYDLDTFGKTGAIVAVNDLDILKLLLEHGINARPTTKQIKITLNVSQDFKNRVRQVAKEEGTFLNTVIVEATEEWLMKREKRKQ